MKSCIGNSKFFRVTSALLALAQCHSQLFPVVVTGVGDCQSDDLRFDSNPYFEHFYRAGNCRDIGLITGLSMSDIGSTANLAGHEVLLFEGFQHGADGTARYLEFLGKVSLCGKAFLMGQLLWALNGVNFSNSR